MFLKSVAAHRTSSPCGRVPCPSVFRIAHQAAFSDLEAGQPLQGRNIVSRNCRQGGRPLQSITLQARETRLVDLAEELAGAHAEALQTVGAVTLEADQMIIAKGMISWTPAGYSSPLEFVAAGDTSTTELHGAGLRVSGYRGDRLKTVLVLRNLSPYRTEVTADVDYETGGDPARLPLPTVSLEPNEGRLVDTSDLDRHFRGAGETFAGVRLRYSGQPGAIIGSLQSVSASGKYVFRVPLLDPGQIQSSTGGYPWRVDDTWNTVVYLKNVTTERQRYVLEFSYGEGRYSVGMRELLPDATVVVDLRSLRDSGVPDAQGRRLPLTALSGQVHWSIRGSERRAIVGRAELVDDATGFSSSYACQNCCPDSYYSSWNVPSSLNTLIDATDLITPYEQDRDCYGTPYTPYVVSWGVSFNSSNTFVQTIDGGGSAHAWNGGSSALAAQWEAYEWYHPTPLECALAISYPQPTTPSTVKVATSLAVVSEPYTDPPPPFYEKRRVYQILDQNGQPMTGYAPNGLYVTENYDPPTASGDCGIGQIETGAGGYARGDGTFDDNYRLGVGAPNPCTSTSWQRIYVNGRVVSFRQVTWTYSGVTIQ